MKKPKQERRSVPFKKLVIKKHYDCFDDFYDANKTKIYKTIVDLFTEFKKSRKKSLNFYIAANIQNLVWDTEFKFSKNEFYILKRDIMPYFEKIEDYETCCQIVKLHDEFTK